MIPLLIAFVAASTVDESAYWTVDHLVTPPGAVLEVGGMDWLPDGRLVCSTRRGQVWIVENALASDPAAAKFTLFAEGLEEGLGLKVVDGQIYVLQRQELSRLTDVDHDGRCDTIENICDSFGVSGNYHEFAYGLPVDSKGNFYMSLNLGFTDPKWWHGRSLAPYRGWVLQIDKQGKSTPFALGFRSPAGLGMNSVGDLFVTDNQGDWEPTCPLIHVQKGKFYGAPASLAWTPGYLETHTEPSLTNPPAYERTPPACWIPYGWARSAAAMSAMNPKFGPFPADQMVVAEMTNGLVLRADLEKVRGEYQGAVMMLRRNVGSSIRTLFASDGTLFVGLTNRGWGGVSPGDGIARIRPTGKKPLEIEHVKLVQDGFEITFTLPIAVGSPVAKDAIDLQQYHYDWWWEYGSPERGTRKLALDSAVLSSDRKRLVMRSKELACGEVARCTLPELLSEQGDPLLHRDFAYTINELPDGPPCGTPVARTAPPPPARESGWEGWLRLSWSDAVQMWKPETWKAADVELDASDKSKLVLKDGSGMLVNAGPKLANFTSKPLFGDGKYHFEVWLPKGGELSVLLMSRYELRFGDPGDDKSPTGLGFGSYVGSKGEVRAPVLNAFRGPGQWHEIDVVFFAPRFDAAGKKTANARIERVLIDDVQAQEAVELVAPSAGAPANEVSEAPLVFRAEPMRGCLGGARVRPNVTKSVVESAEPLPLDDTLAMWHTVGDAKFTADDGTLKTGGKRGFLLTQRADYSDVDVMLRAKVGGGGASALWLRASEAAGGLAGYAIRLNADFPEPAFTGSIANLSPFTVQLVGPETWCDLRARVRDERDGTRITVWVNGVFVNEALDTRADRPRSGAIAFEQHHEGSVTEIDHLAVSTKTK